MVVGVESRGDGNSGGAEAFHGRKRGFDDVENVPELGGFVHVVVEPLVTGREVEFLDESGEMRVRGS